MTCTIRVETLEGGGGSGGSLWIECDRISGSGTVTSTGGSGLPSGTANEFQ